MKPNHLFIALLLVAVPVIVSAGETDHVGCDQVMVQADGMGTVDEQTLQNHIDEVKTTLEEIKKRSGRQAGERRRLLSMHLSNMRSVMKEMHDMKLRQGCEEAMHGSSIEARLNFMEKHMDMMQTMMEQLLEHQQEFERN